LVASILTNEEHIQKIARRLFPPLRVKPKTPELRHDNPLQNLLTFDQFWVWVVTYDFVSANQRRPNEATGGSDGKLRRFDAEASASPKSRRQLRNADPGTSAAQV
jgi:hypothetical protein